MITLNIEWKHFDVNGKTCDCCNSIERALYQEIRQLNIDLHERGIEVILRDKKVKEDEISKSNIILYNGVPIEEILGLNVVEDKSKEDENTGDFGSAIRQAAFKVLGIVDDIKETNSICCCGECKCDSNGCC